MVTEQLHHREQLLKHRNETAALLSVIPGLGHMYKGHVFLGVCLLIISPAFIWIGLLLAFATAGMGFLVPLVYIFFVGWGAYGIDDRRRHHMGII